MAVIAAVMIILLGGTLCVIYLSSYREVYQKDQEMLEHYITSYAQNGNPDSSAQNCRPGAKVPSPREASDQHAFQLSTFYSVAFSSEGKASSIDDNDGSLYSRKELEEFALGVLSRDKSHGAYKSLIYRVDRAADYTLVVFMDNTIMGESITALFRYTLLFGGIAFALIFLLAIFLAKRIVKPIEESYQKQKQFISDAGHELKTPVSVISTNAELLSREIGDNPWLDNIQFEDQRMAALIRQLLELARTEHASPPMAQVDFGKIIVGESLPFESVAFEKGIRLSYPSAAEKIPVHGNKEQLGQLTAILLDNALQHSPKGGTVTVALSAKRRRAYLTVSNQGDAISPHEQEMIFERFYRADPARTGAGDHYGLGLAIAKAIVTAHHGTISVSCEKGLVTFMAVLPTEH